MTRDSVCPRCGSFNVLRIVHGLPRAETSRRTEKGKIALDGCIESDEKPAYQCSGCKHSWVMVLVSRETDPSTLEIVGLVAEILGVAEHIERLLPITRVLVKRRHGRTEKLRDAFAGRLEDARSALRLIQSSVNQHLANLPSDFPPDTIGFPIPESELPILRRGIEGLRSAINAMNKTSYELEGVSVGIPNEVDRYYRISSSGRRVLVRLRETLSGSPDSIPQLLGEVEQYLLQCSNSLREREVYPEQ